MKMKSYEEEDPLQLVGMVLPGAPGEIEKMAECLVEEYVRMGWGEKRLMVLFSNPAFMATHRIYRQKGEEYVRQLIREVQAKWQPRVRGPELIDQEGASNG